MGSIEVERLGSYIYGFSILTLDISVCDACSTLPCDGGVFFVFKFVGNRD